MSSVVKWLQLGFIPRNVDLGLLVLRVALGVQMLYGHGWEKFMTFAEKSATFPDPMGVGPKVSLGLAVFGEVVCAGLLALGLFTRAAAVALVVTMGVAFFAVHKGALSGPQSGEMAFLYLVGFTAIFLAGPGQYSIDAQMGGG